MKNIKNYLMVLALAMVVLPGCVESPGNKLIGRWQGRPVSVQDRVKDKAATERPTGSAAESTQTVLEKFDFTMTLDFVDASRVRMVLDQAGQPQSKSGTWRMISSSAENMTIEITLPTSESASPSEATTGATRQFTLKLDPKNKNRFWLSEVNADVGLGAIVFERNSSK